MARMKCIVAGQPIHSIIQDRMLQKRKEIRLDLQSRKIVLNDTEGEIDAVEVLLQQSTLSAKRKSHLEIVHNTKKPKTSCEILLKI